VSGTFAFLPLLINRNGKGGAQVSVLMDCQTVTNSVLKFPFNGKTFVRPLFRLLGQRVFRIFQRGNKLDLSLVLLYAPRDSHEIETIFKIIDAGVQYNLEKAKESAKL